MQEQRTQLICAKCHGQWLQAYAQGKCGKCNEWTFAVSAKVEPIAPVELDSSGQEIPF
jgi:predicted ATP-dependent serine protease